MRRLILPLLLLGLTVSAEAATGSNPPNILFIMTDQQSADAMSCRIGRQFLHTPTMDALAKAGTQFTRAYVANPLCMPSRNSLFTGRYPHETGITHNRLPAGGLNPRELVCLGTYFRNAGFDTGYSGKWHLAYNINNTNAHGFEFVVGGGKSDHDGDVTAGAVDFLERKRAKPFLLVASFLNPHNICEWSRRLAGKDGQVMTCGEIGEPPGSWQLPPLPSNLALPRNEPDGLALMRRAYQVDTGAFPVSNFTEEDWRKLRWGYYRMVEKVDAEIGKVLEALRRAGAEENTLIVFTSDHGECAGAHGFNQKTVFYEESVRVPLVVACKGRSKRRVSDKLVNTGIDLLPTMLDFAGLEIPQRLPGRSLLPLVFGSRVRGWRDHVISGNDMTQAGEVNDLKPHMTGRMVRSEQYKYCVYSRGERRESLVDLDADPMEMNDLAADPAYEKVLLRHRKLLSHFGREHKDTLVDELLANDVRSVPFSQ